jgi:hypothetical protein
MQPRIIGLLSLPTLTLGHFCHYEKDETALEVFRQGQC